MAISKNRKSPKRSRFGNIVANLNYILYMNLQLVSARHTLDLLKAKIDAIVVAHPKGVPGSYDCIQLCTGSLRPRDSGTHLLRAICCHFAEIDKMTPCRRSCFINSQFESSVSRISDEARLLIKILPNEKVIKLLANWQEMKRNQPIIQRQRGIPRVHC